MVALIGVTCHRPVLGQSEHESEMAYWTVRQAPSIPHGGSISCMCKKLCDAAGLTENTAGKASVLNECEFAGHSCWGILNGPATGLVMAELIAEGTASSIDIRRLDPQRLA